MYDEEHALELKQRVRADFAKDLLEYIQRSEGVGRLLGTIPDAVFQYASVSLWDDSITLDVPDAVAHTHIRKLLGKFAYATKAGSPFVHRYIRYRYILASIPIETGAIGSCDRLDIENYLDQAGVDWTSLHIDIHRQNCRRVQVGTEPVYEYVCDD